MWGSSGRRRRRRCWPRGPHSPRRAFVRRRLYRSAAPARLRSPPQRKSQVAVVSPKRLAAARPSQRLTRLRLRPHRTQRSAPDRSLHRVALAPASQRLPPSCRQCRIRKRPARSRPVLLRRLLFLQLPSPSMPLQPCRSWPALITRQHQSHWSSRSNASRPDPHPLRDTLR